MNYSFWFLHWLIIDSLKNREYCPRRQVEYSYRPHSAQLILTLWLSPVVKTQEDAKDMELRDKYSLERAWPT